MTDNATKALAMLYRLTAGRPYSWGWSLCGRSMVGARQAILATLLGRAVIQREAGINALTSALCEACDIPRDCSAVMTRKIAELAETIGGVA